ncbi:MAG: (2Fe-2S) ferredoxin domain-containing protein, partial [Lachnospiraceae bacterium]|nr:(2Fe-2S) ferredoxin domain-containing protein [Lachnospiraceae bacterium]
MEKIKSFEQLEKTTSSCTKCLEEKLSGFKGKRAIVLCGGTGCISSHSTEIMEEFKKQLKARKLDKDISVNQVGCFGFCSQGPFVKIYPEDTL